MQRLDWNTLNAAQRSAALARPAQARSAELREGVARIIADVRARGDDALRELTARHDHCVLDSIEVTAAEMAAAETELPAALKAALAEAAARIEHYHRATMNQPIAVETAPGVRVERISRAIERVGLYVPAGSAPLPSTALMLGIPARLAGCAQVVLCSPARADGRCDAAVLHAARLVGVQRVFKLGGAQAIDMPAGPSEVMVIADAEANPAFVAADLLSQAEHGADSQVMLVTPATGLLDAVALEVARQCAALPRADIAQRALSRSRLIHVASLAQAVQVANAYAPEHLIVHTAQPRALLADVQHAGAVFLGPWTPEAVGDYCSGSNHVLPTDGKARTFSGLSVASYQKQITVQELSVAGLRAIGPCTEALATAEQLQAHRYAVSVRLAALDASEAASGQCLRGTPA